MYKYYKQLDNPLNQMVKISDYGEYQSYYVRKYIDEKFLESNRKIFVELNSIYNKYKLITYNLVDEKIKDQKLKDKILYSMNKIKQNIYDGEILYTRNVFDFDKVSYDDINAYLITIKALLDVVRYIFPNKLYYDRVLKDISILLKKVDNKDILYKSKEIVVNLPDAWYLTKEGYLYNTMGINGHKESSLIYPFEEIQCNLKNYDKEINKYRNELEDTVNRGYVTPDQCRHYLNIRGMYTQIEKDKIYDRQFNMLVTGIIAAHIDLYEAFNQFYKMDNPMQEYFKMLRLTNFEMDDMFVRFLGMSKLGVSGTKTICTANTNDMMFNEYIKRGFNIDLVNPIKVVNNHIEEINLDNHKIMKKVLDKNFKSALKER